MAEGGYYNRPLSGQSRWKIDARPVDCIVDRLRQR
jgi:hypothetical protein